MFKSDVKGCNFVENFQGQASSTSHVTFIHEDQLLRQEICEIWESKRNSDLNIVCLGDGQIVKTHQVYTFIFCVEF